MLGQMYNYMSLHHVYKVLKDGVVLIAVSVIITAGNEALSKEQIDTKKNVAYEDSKVIKMTECEAYDTLPNRP